MISNLVRLLKAFLLKKICSSKEKEFSLENTKKILFLRYDRIGDMVLTSPIFRELKKGLNNCEISVLASKQNLPVISSNPFIDKIFLNNEGNFFSVLKTLYKLRKNHYDVCIEFDHSVVPHAILRLKLINAKKVISPRKDGRYGVLGSDLELYNFYSDFSLDNTITNNWMNILKFFNIHNPSNKLEFYISKKINAEINKRIRPYKNKFLIGINFDGAVKGKEIQISDLLYISRELLNIDRNILIFLIASPSKYNYLKKILQNVFIPNFISDFETQTIQHAAGLISNCQLIISPDTSIVHIAACYDVPVVSIHEANMHSYKLFRPNSSISYTEFSPCHSSLYGFRTRNVINFAKKIIKERI